MTRDSHSKTNCRTYRLASQHGVSSVHQRRAEKLQERKQSAYPERSVPRVDRIVRKELIRLNKWVRELLWVRRNDQGIIVGISEELPKHGDFIPTLVKQNQSQYIRGDHNEKQGRL